MTYRGASVGLVRESVFAETDVDGVGGDDFELRSPFGLTNWESGLRGIFLRYH